MKRSSYSYVSKSASSSAGNGLSAKRPLAVRGIMPTHQSDNSLNSHNTGGSGNAVGAGTFGAAEDTTRASLNDERPSAGSAAGLDASLQVEPELAVEAPAQVSTTVPASLLASIEVITPMARGPGGASRGAVSSTRLSSSTPAAEATTTTVATGGDEGNVDTEEFVTSSSIEPISVPETPQSSTEDVGEPSALQSEDAFQVTGEADADATTPLEPSEHSSEYNHTATEESAGDYSADVSHDGDEEDFQVMSDRGAGHSNRHYRVKRSVDPTTLQFNEQYDGSEQSTPVSKHRSPALSLNSEEVKAGVAAMLEEQVRKVEQGGAGSGVGEEMEGVPEPASPVVYQSYPSSGKNEAWI